MFHLKPSHSLILLYCLPKGFLTDICPADVTESLPLSAIEADDLSIRVLAIVQ